MTIYIDLLTHSSVVYSDRRAIARLDIVGENLTIDVGLYSFTTFLTFKNTSF